MLPSITKATQCTLLRTLQWEDDARAIWMCRGWDLLPSCMPQEKEGRGKTNTQWGEQWVSKTSWIRPQSRKHDRQQKLGLETREGFFLGESQESTALLIPCLTVQVWIFDLYIPKIINICVFSHAVCGNLLKQQEKKINIHNNLISTWLIVGNWQMFCKYEKWKRKEVGWCKKEGIDDKQYKMLVYFLL